MDKLCVLTYGGFGLLKASLYGRPVQFRNTLRHWPMSVEEMGQRLGYPKLPFDPTNLEYCQRDCEVTYRFIHEMFSRYKELGWSQSSQLCLEHHSGFSKINFAKSHTLDTPICLCGSFFPRLDMVEGAKSFGINP